MKAAVFNEIGKPLEIKDVEKPQAGPGELLIKVEACGICGSDLHAIHAPGFLSTGQILGHEYAGEVVEIGPGAVGDWQLGDRVTAIGGKICGTCVACQRGEYIECPDLVLQGYDQRMQGAFTEYVTCFSPFAVKLPDNVSLRDAASAEPLNVGLAAWRLGAVPTGGSVMIVGAGPIGLSLIKWARFFGARDIVVSEMAPARMELAKEVGATLVIDASKEENPFAAMEKAIGRRASVVFECVGRPLFEKLVSQMPYKAHLVMCGTGLEQENFTVFNTSRKAPQVSFLLGSDLDDFKFVIEMLANGRMSVAPLCSGEIGLDQVPEMFEELQQPNQHCKVVVTP